MRQSIPAVKGVYALVIDISREVRIEIGSLGKHLLRKGCYVYVGSAKGPGGLRGRISRHLRKNRRKRWHVDYVLEIGEVKLIAYVASDISECSVVKKLLKIGLTAPIKGLGSSDCKQGCPAHMLYTNDPSAVMRYLRAMFKTVEV